MTLECDRTLFTNDLILQLRKEQPERMRDTSDTRGGNRLHTIQVWEQGGVTMTLRSEQCSWTWQKSESLWGCLIWELQHDGVADHDQPAKGETSNPEEHRGSSLC